MHNFTFNYSPLSESHQMIISKEIINIVRIYARQLLLPFFQQISITMENVEDGDTYPVLTDMAESILENIDRRGRPGNKSEAMEIGTQFLSNLNNTQRYCLRFYFCTQESFVEELEETITSSQGYDTPQDIIDKEVGLSIISAIKYMSDSDLTEHLADELIHLQDIFSTEDISSWDVSSVAFANENFQSYLGAQSVDLRLIPTKEDEWEYWSRVFKKISTDEEE